MLRLVMRICMTVAVLLVLARPFLAMPERPSNALLIFSHILQGMDPAGPPQLFDDTEEEDDNFTQEDDDDDSIFSFFG
ncbi:uncharacterized protein [Panulirus ornatus]|uniref:uncharacterized protein n=1 Tax=Panulirus ornatus TaxID=150431 RepID=UPI003A8634C2